MNSLPRSDSNQPPPERCLVTGASGFIGTRFCERLNEQGKKSFVPMVRSPAAAEPLRERGFQPVVCDLLVRSDVKRALQGCDAVVHLAQGYRAPVATRQLVESAIEKGVRRFVHISTMSVHGPTPGPDAAREETARIGRYNHDYSDSKAEEEETVQAAYDRGDLQAVILRPTIVYGPRGHFVLQIIEEARTGVVTLFDQGAGCCNAVYVDDVCDAIEMALIRPQADGQAMFVNGDESITWGEFIRTFALMVEPAPSFLNLSSAEALAYWAANPPVPIGGLPSRVWRKLKRLSGWKPPTAPWPPAGRVMRETLQIAFSNDKAKRLLDWAPKSDFHRGAESTRAWLVSEGYAAR